MNFPLKTALAAAHKFYVVSSFSFSSTYFLFSFDTSSLTCGLFRIMLLSFKVLRDHPVIFLLLISSLILLGSENILYIVSIALNLLSLSYDPVVFLVSVPWALEKNVYSAVVWSSF